MGSVVDVLAAREKEAERQLDRIRKMRSLAAELGEEGLAELAGLLAPQAPAPRNGNGNGHGGNGHEREPRGREAVRRIVRQRPGVWTLAELRAEMQARGWFSSDTGLEAAAKRLCKINGEGKRIGRGRYVFPANHGEEVAIESRAHDASGVMTLGE